MLLLKTIIISIFFTSLISKAYASSDFYLGTEYLYDEINVNKIDDIVAGYFPLNIQLSDTSKNSYKSGGVYIGYKFHSNLSIEVGYAQSKTEKKHFEEQGALLFDGVSKISLKSYRIELLGEYPFQSLSKFSLLGSIGVVFKEADMDVEFKELIVCTAQVGANCPPFIVTNIDEVNQSTRMQYGIGAQYKFSNNISTRFIVKSALTSFSFSSGTPYSLNLGVQYHF